MQVDFYAKSEKVMAVEKFGLVDPDDSTGKFPAFVSYDSSNDKWNATVISNKRGDYSFIPYESVHL